jgi:hypothetical protein
MFFDCHPDESRDPEAFKAIFHARFAQEHQGRKGKKKGACHAVGARTKGSLISRPFGSLTHGAAIKAQ